MANSSLFSAFNRMWQHIATALNEKVDKVNDKGLSTNDFTNEYKEKIDALENAIIKETDPTVPNWAKANEKPTYTAAEVGAPTIDEMNTAIAAITIPTKTSELINDSNFKTTDNNTTYSLSQSETVITLIGSDGSTTSVTGAIGPQGPQGPKGESGATMFTYGTTDLTAGVSTLATGHLYFVYE